MYTLKQIGAALRAQDEASTKNGAGPGFPLDPQLLAYQVQALASVVSYSAMVFAAGDGEMPAAPEVVRKAKDGLLNTVSMLRGETSVERKRRDVKMGRFARDAADEGQ